MTQYRRTRRASRLKSSTEHRVEYKNTVCMGRNDHGCRYPPLTYQVFAAWRMLDILAVLDYVDSKK